MIMIRTLLFLVIMSRSSFVVSNNDLSQVCKPFRNFTMLKIFLKFGKLSRSFLIFVCPLGEKFPAWASHSWSRPTCPRTVGEYEYCLFSGILADQYFTWPLPQGGGKDGKNQSTKWRANSKLLQQHFAKNYKQAATYTSHETELGFSCSFSWSCFFFHLQF